MQSIELVREFHETFEHPIGLTPMMPDAKTVDFRVDFMKEELNELLAAFAADDLVELADALGDIQYVLDGFFLNAGLHNKKGAILNEIHRSNMSKLCNNTAEVITTLRDLPHVIYDVKKIGTKYAIYRESDNKVMKSAFYSKPDLNKIINDPNIS